jgi:glutamine amidotransferase
MIALIDFGAGNLKSAEHAFSQLGSTRVIERPGEITGDTKALVLPGDGSFRSAYERLVETGFSDYLKNENLRPLLGICVGYQLLFDFSEEDGGSPGLSLIAGNVKKFPRSVGKIPHMGWNQVAIKENKKSSPLIQGVQDDDFFYFVHSFYSELTPSSQSAELLSCDYGFPFCAAVEMKNISGFQFHPEKSHDLGRKLLKNFVEEVKAC